MSVASDVVSPGKLHPEQKEAMLRLVGSSTFASAPRLRSVLVYLMQIMDEGSSEDVTEQTIGQAVFHRPAGYNASEDNIVRVTIRHLRARLEEFYISEGASETLILVIPKGKYVPSFVQRTPVAMPQPAIQTQPVLLPDEPVSVPPEFETYSARRPYHVGWVFAAVVLLAFGIGFGMRSLYVPNTPAQGILGALLHKGDTVTVVAVDGNLQAYRGIFGHQITLDNYIHRIYSLPAETDSNPVLTGARHLATNSDQTNISSAIIGLAIQKSLVQQRVLIRHPHELSIRNFQGPGMVILLGGPWSDPWGQLFENHFNFRLVPQANNPATPDVQNLHPTSGEAALYHPHQEGALTVNYVRIAILPNLDGVGNVILLSATSAESLEAAGSYLLSPDSKQEILQHFGVHSALEFPPSEFLLQVSGLNSVPESHRILAFRYVR
jgi:hypothetical protein